jgi:hypothetical protein
MHSPAQKDVQQELFEREHRGQQIATTCTLTKKADFSGWTLMPHQEDELSRGPMKTLEIT